MCEQRTTRREFLVRSGSVAAGLGLAFVSGPAGAATKAARKPLVIACRDVHLRVAGTADVWSAMNKIGVEGVEVWLNPDGSCPHLFGPGRRHTIASAEGLRRLEKELQAHRKRITAFCMPNRFDERPDEEIRYTQRAARAAKQLGVPAVRIDVVARRIKDRDRFLQFAIEICKRMLDASAETDIRFGIENHGTTTNRPEFLEALFEGVGSDRLGLTLDTANFYWFGHPLEELYRIYARFAKRVVHTHCKSIRYPESERNRRRPVGWKYGQYTCPVYEGDIDMGRVVKILREAGYANDLCIENESLRKFPQAERAAVLAREVAYLRKVAG